MLNLPANQAAFAAAVVDGIYEKSGLQVTVINVIAVDVTSRRRRARSLLLTDSVDVSFEVVMPVTAAAGGGSEPTADDQTSVFNAVTAGLTEAAEAGGVIAAGVTEIDPAVTLDATTFEPPVQATDMQVG